VSLKSKLSRRQLLNTLAVAGVGAVGAPLLAACQPKVVEVEKVVKETVVVETEKEVEVEKVVKETVVVEKTSDAAEIRFLTRVGPLGLFMKEYSNIYQEKSGGAIKVVIEEGNWEDVSTKLMTGAVAGTLADVFWQPYFFMPYHAANDVMFEMDEFAASGSVDMSVWYPWAIDLEKLDGKLYGLPMGVMTGYNTIIYNTNILEQAGVPEPSGDMSWSDLREVAKGIKENTGVWGMDIGHWYWGTETIIRGFGGHLFEPFGDVSLFLDEPVQEALKMIYEVGNVDKTMPTAAAMEGDRAKMFASGKLAMMVNCAADLVCGMADAIGGRFGYKYATIPTADYGILGTQQQADSLHIFSQSKYPQEAFGLCAEIAGIDASKWACLTTGMTPGACPAAWEDPEVAAKYPWYGVEGVWFKTNVPEPPPMPGNLRHTEMASAYEAEWTPIKNGERPYDQENLEAINAVFQEILSKPRP